MNLVGLYGVTKDPNTQNYALVLELKNGGLRSYLDQNYNSLSWKMKLNITLDLCFGLINLHDNSLIHKDLHIGNVLYSMVDKNDMDISICDFGFCKPANEISSTFNTYGVMPYMAPEILRGKKY